ncbi:SAV_2336 N-terminal domain-related protein [Actinomadura sp. NPDC000600]|uniref:SAV_2336 N-terminal domain-related protein n=1 Tax=Actinomadura sp. NPDC000600 TaxID=3154262 RepID=UPI00339279C6
MTINRLRDVLSAIGPPPDARELSEMLWLACHISPTEEQGPAVSPATPPVADGPVDAPSPPKPPEPAPPRPSEPLTGLHPRPAAEAEPVGRASEVLVPTAPMLADPLGVQRALRPLKRRVPSRHRVELDEEATAARVADTRLWTPVLVPSPERWLGLDLVIDTGPTMRLWRPLARELAETLLRQGAFQDVHLSHLDGTGRVSSTPEAPPQDPRTLLDASGRRAVLVLSDCSGPHWWNGRAVQAVRRWAQAGPTAIVQPLAERLWRRTAAPPSPGLAALPRPGAPNTGLRFTPYDGAAGAGVPVPVLEIAPRWFGTWARLVSGADPQPAAVAMLPARPSGTAPVRREQELPIAERVRRFLATASPDAAELAAHVAVSVPSLPVMRLIQHRILGGSGPGRLAEVLLSGLLRPAGGVRYEFVPGAREALLDTLPRPEALHTRHVLEAVSAEIERRAGTSAETFRALLPEDGGPVVLTADTDHFALVTPEARSHLTPGPPPPEVPQALDLLDLFDTPAEELLDEWGEAPREIPIGEDSGGPVTLDVLRTNPELPHGLIIAPPHDRAELVRTTLFSLALTHSPDIVNLVFVGFHGSGGFTGLAGLPHVAYYAFAHTHDSPLISMQVPALEDERIRRTRALENAGFSTWDEYQTAIAEGADHAPLPALVVVIDDTGPLLDARPDLIEPLAWLCETGAPLGMRFVFCTSKDAPLPSPLRDHLGWNIGVPGEGVAFLHVFADRTHPAFQPAHIYSDAAHRLIEKMDRQGRRARELPWPEEPRPAQLELDLGEPEPSSDGDVFLPEVPADAVPPGMLSREFDVLSLNGGGSDGILRETWAMSADTPRSPAIGYRPSGHLLSLYPLDRSSGIPHGLIVGSPAARQRIVRAITLALASGHSPADLQFVFAGLGEHPLGEPIDLPHVRYSEEELLGSPNRLRRFFDFLSGELEARSAPPPQNVPRDSIRATDPWSVDELYERFRQDPHSVDRVWWNFFEDYQPGERPAVPPPEAPPEARPRLVVVADVSLTFPLSRPEIGETLLSLAQRGRALDVQLLLTSSTVENTTIWGRFLPLLGWRIAANRLPPDQLQYVLGQASLEFPADEPTAYLLAGGGAPQRFTLAPEPPRDVIDDFVRRTREVPRGSSTGTAPEGIGLEEIDRLLAGLDEELENGRRSGGEPVDATTVKSALREILSAVTESTRSGDPRPIRHLIFPGPFRPEMNLTASLYGEVLADLGLLPRGDSSLLTVSYTRPHPDADPAADVTRLLRSVRSTVFLVWDAPDQDPETGYLSPDMIHSLISMMRQERDGPLVALCGEPERFEEYLQTIPEFAERFRWVHAFDARAASERASTARAQPPASSPPSASATGSRSVRLGRDPETGEPVLLDFGADRHLLISGPSDTGKSPLVHRMAEDLASIGTEDERLVYVLDTYMSPSDLADAEARGRAGVRYTASLDKFGVWVSEAVGTAKTPLTGRGPQVYMLVAHRPRPGGKDPIATALRDLSGMGEHRVHFVLARHDVSPEEPLDPVVALLRELGSPVLLTSFTGGHEARLWDVPSSLRGAMRMGDGLLAHPGRQRLLRLDNPVR